MNVAAQTWRPGLSLVRSRPAAPNSAPTFVDHLRKRAEKEAARVWPDLWSSLTAVGQQQFIDELLAVRIADMKGLQRVVESWYRTLELRQDESYLANMARAEEVGLEPPITSSEELKQRLSL